MHKKSTWIFQRASRIHTQYVPLWWCPAALASRTWTGGGSGCRLDIGKKNHDCTAESHYNTIIFLQNTHNGHSIARPWGRAMECPLWVHSQIYWTSDWHAARHNTLQRFNCIIIHSMLWGLNNMADILQTTFSKAFSSMKISQILITISLKYILGGSNDDMSALV